MKCAVQHIVDEVLRSSDMRVFPCNKAGTQTYWEYKFGEVHVYYSQNYNQACITLRCLVILVAWYCSFAFNASTSVKRWN